VCRAQFAKNPQGGVGGPCDTVGSDVEGRLPDPSLDEAIGRSSKQLVRRDRDLVARAMR